MLLYCATCKTETTVRYGQCIPCKQRATAERARVRALARESEKRQRRAGRERPHACECCGAVTSYPLYFDHDHNTGNFRGWLCRACNFALGHVDDSPEHLRKLINYLEHAPDWWLSTKC